jgi:Ca2+-binding EF-hand superfamily protein
MGAQESVPTPDLRTKRAMALCKLTFKEVGVFYQAFKKLDTENKNSVDMESYYGVLEERRSIYGEGIFEVLDIAHVGRINFGEFVQSIVVMCLFEEVDVLKFAFYVFDKDKNGYVEKDELDTILNVFHHVGPGERLKGNQRIAKSRLKIVEDGKVEFEDIQKVAQLYPSLWYPAFRLQAKMMTQYFGERWWARKKRRLQDIKEAKALRKIQKLREADNKFENLRQRKIRKKMGVLKYYICPWNRNMYDKLFPKRAKDKLGTMTPEELLELRRKAREEARRLEELLIKNPETQTWKNYKRQKEVKLRSKWAEAKKIKDEGVKVRKKVDVSDRTKRIERRRERYLGEDD